MTEAGRGIVAVLSACVIWGFSPILYRQLAHVPALEVLAHRMLWSLIFFGSILWLQGRFGAVRVLFRQGRRTWLMALGAAVILVNWFLFIWAIQSGRSVEASLGYYISPLVLVLLGVLFHAEGMGPVKAVAFGLAALAVTVLTVGLGAPPWIALVLGTTFGFYGLIKKSVAAGPVVSVTAEVLMFSPLVLVYLLLIHNSATRDAIGAAPGTFGTDLSDSLLLILSGPLTASPLVLFSYGAKRATLAAVGLAQYLNPTLQFGVAVLIFADPFTGWHAIAFPLIWLALGLYSAQAVAQDRSARRAVKSAGTSSTIVK